MRCPSTVVRGHAAGSIGVVNNRNAVGPGDGKSDGVPVAIASMATMPIVSRPFKNANDPSTIRRSEDEPPRWWELGRRAGRNAPFAPPGRQLEPYVTDL